MNDRLNDEQVKQVAIFLYNNLSQNSTWSILASQSEMASVAKRWLKETAEGMYDSPPEQPKEDSTET